MTRKEFLEKVKEFCSYTSYSEEAALTSVRYDGMLIKNVHPDVRTDHVKMTAVRNNGLALQHLSKEEQTEKICIEAVAENKDAMEFVKLDFDEEEEADGVE
jgi:hypothetical protein